MRERIGEFLKEQLIYRAHVFMDTHGWADNTIKVKFSNTELLITPYQSLHQEFKIKCLCGCLEQKTVVFQNLILAILGFEYHHWN